MMKGHNAHDQIKSIRAWSDCLLCILFILNAGYIHVCVIVTSWRLGLPAPLVARNYFLKHGVAIDYKLYTHFISAVSMAQVITSASQNYMEKIKESSSSLKRYALLSLAPEASVHVAFVKYCHILCASYTWNNYMISEPVHRPSVFSSKSVERGWPPAQGGSGGGRRKKTDVLYFSFSRARRCFRKERKEK